eukprot:4942142-Prymnesium_polylepis.1
MVELNVSTGRDLQQLRAVLSIDDCPLAIRDKLDTDESDVQRDAIKKECALRRKIECDRATGWCGSDGGAQLADGAYRPQTTRGRNERRQGWLCWRGRRSRRSRGQIAPLNRNTLAHACRWTQSRQQTVARCGSEKRQRTASARRGVAKERWGQLACASDAAKEAGPRGQSCCAARAT